jgi:hypothetical protein
LLINAAALVKGAGFRPCGVDPVAFLVHGPHIGSTFPSLKFWREQMVHGKGNHVEFEPNFTTLPNLAQLGSRTAAPGDDGDRARNSIGHVLTAPHSAGE